MTRRRTGLAAAAIMAIAALVSGGRAQESTAPPSLDASSRVRQLLAGAAPALGALDVEASYFVGLQVAQVSSSPDVRRARLVLRVDLSTFGTGDLRPERLEILFGLRFADGHDAVFSRAQRANGEELLSSKTYRIDMAIPRQGVLRAAVIVADPVTGLSGEAVAEPIWTDMRPLDLLPTEPVPSAEAVAEPLVVDLGPYAAVDSDDRAATPIELPVIRLLLPPAPVFVGRQVLATLVGTAGVARVRFLVDGEPVGEAAREPWELRYKFDRSGLPHTIEAVALAADDRELGRDLGRVNVPADDLWIRILEPIDEESGRWAPVRVGVPAQARLRRVTVFLDDRELARVERGSFEVPLPLSATGTTFLRVEAELEDGRTAEDVCPLFAPGYGEEVEVALVELYPRIVDAEGRPARIEKENLELTVDGAERAVDRVVPSEELPLLVGIAVDTSGSMAKLVHALRTELVSLLATLEPGRDRIFVTRFWERSVLAQPPTTDSSLLGNALAGVPIGGETALYDGIVHGLIQFDRKSTRRALFVLTDGLATEGRFDAERTLPVARRLAVPIFALVAIEPKLASVRLPELVSLRRLVARSGGGYVQLLRADELAAQLREYVDGLRAQTLVAFHPDSEPSTKRRWHRVELRSKVPGIRIEGELGYYSGRE